MGILLLFGRLFVQRDLLNISEQLGVTEASIHVIPVLTAFTEDLEPVVRSTMMEKIPGLARFFLDVRLLSFFPLPPSPSSRSFSLFHTRCVEWTGRAENCD